MNCGFVSQGAKSHEKITGNGDENVGADLVCVRPAFANLCKNNTEPRVKKPRAKSQEPRNQEPRAKKPRAKKPRAKSQEPRAKSQEPKAMNYEPS